MATSISHLVVVLLVMGGHLMVLSRAQLSPAFYSASCPDLEKIVRADIIAALVQNPTAPAALLRLMFHDCQVQGCDASILLDTQPGIISERESPSNFGIRRLEFIDRAKAAVEAACPGTVSCADIVILAAREAVRIAGGPTIQNVPLGRRDATTANAATATAQLPPADTRFPGFFQVFASKGMTIAESVAILGAHTLGVGHCISVVNRIYPQKDSELGFLYYNILRLRCPAQYSSTTLIPNDLTPLSFDNQYFSQSSSGRGLFQVDADVASNPLTSPYVNLYRTNPIAFFQDFSSAFIKLSLSNVLTGNQGEVRQNCRLLN